MLGTEVRESNSVIVSGASEKVSPAPPSVPENVSLSNIKLSVREALDNNADFNMRQFPIESPRIARIIDRGYREQLVTEAELRVEKAYLEALRRGLPTAEAAESATRSALKYAVETRGELARVWRQCEKLDVISFMGTARSEVVDPELKHFDGTRGKAVLYHFIEKLGQSATAAGISGLNGGSSTGIMGAQTNSWDKGRALLSADAEESAAKIIAIPLKFHKDNREVPTEKASNGYMTPAMSTFLGRTPALLAFGRQYTVEDARQRIMVINPGGLGTLEEVGRVLSEIKIQGQVTGVFSGSRIKPPLVVLVSPEFVPNTPFWSGQVRFFEMMRMTGAWRGSMEDNLIVVEPQEKQDAERLVHNIVTHYAGDGDMHDKSAPSELAGLTEVQLGVLRALDKMLSADIQFTARLFHGDHPSYLRILDAQFEEEARIQAERYALRRIVQLEVLNQDKLDQAELDQNKGDVLLTAIDEARKLAISWRGQLKELVDLCHGTKTLTIIGSGNTGVWNEQLEHATSQLMAEAVAKGYTVVVGGDGREGVSEKVCSSWLLEKALHDACENASPSTSKLVRIQLDMEGRTTAPMDFEGQCEILGPAVQSVITKSGLLTALGEENCVVVYPHGITELEAVDGAVLAAQLAGSVDTPFRGKAKPPGIFFLNADLGFGRFFAGKQEQYQMIAETGTADSDFLDTLQFLDIEDPRNVVETICAYFNRASNVA